MNTIFNVYIQGIHKRTVRFQKLISVCCARVRREIYFLLTFETAPFFCVYPVYMFYFIPIVIL
jgi:hypothetical protein